MGWLIGRVGRQMVALVVSVCMVFMAVTAVAITASSEASRDQAEKAVQQYVKDHSLQLPPGSQDYRTFLKDILWGLHPDLQKPEILSYASNYLSHVTPIEQPSSKPSQVPPNESGKVGTLSGSWTYNAGAAVQYAYDWTTNGSVKRNPAYPDFGAEDCTNFASQVVHAGGVPTVGSGSCGWYNTTTQWFVNRSSWWCLTNGWALSSSWGRVTDFWNYHTQKTSNATSTTYTASQLDQLRATAVTGDIVQLQPASGGAKFHSMVLTKKENGELYFTYHAGPQGKDVVDKSLAAVAQSGTYNYFLLHFN